MNVGGAAIVLRERTLLDVLDLSVLFCQRALRPYLMLTGLLLAPTWVLLVLMRYAFDFEWTWVWLSALGVQTLLELPFLTLAGRLLFEPKVSARAALAGALRRLPAYFFTQLLVMLIFAASVVTFIGPWIVATMYCFVPEILVLEGASGVGAMRRAQRFLNGRSGTGLATVLLRGALMATLVVFGEQLGQATLSVLLDVHMDVEELWEDGGSPFALAGLLASVPLAATFRFLSYVSERTVQDGWDVQVALLSLAGDRARGDEA